MGTKFEYHKEMSIQYKDLRDKKLTYNFDKAPCHIGVKNLEVFMTS